MAKRADQLSTDLRFALGRRTAAGSLGARSAVQAARGARRGSAGLWAVRLYDVRRTAVRLCGCTPYGERRCGCTALRMYGWAAVRLYGCTAVRLYGCTVVRRTAVLLAG